MASSKIEKAKWSVQKGIDRHEVKRRTHSWFHVSRPLVPNPDYFPDAPVGPKWLLGRGQTYAVGRTLEKAKEYMAKTGRAKARYRARG